MLDAAPALRLHHVGTSVPDLDAAVAWYCDTLGFVRDYEYPIQSPHLNARVAFLRLGDCRIGLFEVEGSTLMPAHEGDLAAGPHGQGIKHCTLATPDLEASMRASDPWRRVRHARARGARLGRGALGVLPRPQRPARRVVPAHSAVTRRVHPHRPHRGSHP